MLNDQNQIITDAIIAELEKGTLPWARGYTSSKGAAMTSLPINAATQRRYRGINILLLWGRAHALGVNDLRFLTYKQALDMGGNVRKGEKSAKVYFYQPIINKTLDPETGEKIDKRGLIAKEFSVFHVSQCEGIDFGDATPLPIVGDAWPQEVEEIAKALDCDLGLSNGTPYYDPLFDRVHMPHYSQWKSLEHYRHTFFHEAAHWTGHKSRLTRDFSGVFGTPKYAKEEMIAELAASFLAAEYGEAYISNSAAYINNWLQALKNDKRMVWQAASAAQKAVDYIRMKALGVPMAQYDMAA